jgi:hypothetical protein
MLHLDGYVWLDAGHRGQDVIQHLLRRHAELAATRADLQPPGLVAVIALGEVLGADQDEIAVVG